MKKMNKNKNINLLLLMFLLLFIGIISKTNISQATTELIQMNTGNYTNAYVSTKDTTIALMSNYMPFTNSTLYSGTTISSITITSKENGILYIGTAKVEDIVNARKKGTVIKNNSKKYNITKGTNNLTLNLTIDEKETLILHNGTVSLEYIINSNEIDENKVFTLINGTKNSTIINVTNNIKDQLNIEIDLNSATTTSLTDNRITSVTSDVIKESYTSNVTKGYEPFIFGDLTLFSSKRISKIGVGIQSISAIDGNQTFTFYVVKANDLKSNNLLTNAKKYTIKFDQKDLETATFNSDNRYDLNKWVYVDISNLNIEVSNDETLAFGHIDDTIKWSYSLTNNDNDSFYINTQKTNMSLSQGYLLHLDIHVLETTKYDVEEHLSKLEENEKIAKLKHALNGKKMSILGDSISTFEGYSNDSINTNDTIGNNAVYYGGNSNLGSSILKNVDQTWWKKVSNQLEMDILVNNSWSGSEVFASDKDGGAYGLRSKNLHDNTGDNAGTTPDIIVVYMGTNDAHLKLTVGTYDKETINEFLKSDKSPTTFAEAYAIMLNNIVTKYDTAEIYCFTMLHFTRVTDTNTQEYNEVIRQLAKHFNVNLVDLYNDTNVKLNNQYFGENTYTHPNENGMIEIANTFINALAKEYEEYELTDEENLDNNLDENNNKEDKQEEVENPFTSTNLIKIISLILIVGSIIVLIHTFKNTKINKYE